MCIELRLRLTPSRRHDFFGRDFPAEHAEYFAHRHARIRADGQKRGLRLLRRLGPCYAEKVPGGILDVVRIHRAVRLKLRAAIREAAHVIEGNAALPQMRSIAGAELGDTVETGG